MDLLKIGEDTLDVVERMGPIGMARQQYTTPGGTRFRLWRLGLLGCRFVRIHVSILAVQSSCNGWRGGGQAVGWCPPFRMHSIEYLRS